jgi:hypothetical protein
MYSAGRRFARSRLARRLLVELLEDRTLLAGGAPTDLILLPSVVCENQPAGMPVGTLFSVDPDLGEIHGYQLVAGAGDDDNGAFSIDGNVLKTAATFDYETRGAYSIRLRSIDGEGRSVEKQIAVSIADAEEAAADDRLEWLTQFGGPIASTDESRAVATDLQGNSYVVGWTDGALSGQASAGNLDVYFRKYDANGSELWTRQFGSSAYDYGQAVTADASGVYVAGYTTAALPGQTTAGNHDAFVRKYDANGEPLWTAQFGTSSIDVAYGLATYAGGVCVAGYTSGALPGQSAAGGIDGFVRAYDAGGTVQWTRQFGSSGTDLAYGVAADSSGIYVTGYTTAALPGQTWAGWDDVFVRKYDFSGAEQWTRQFGTSSGDRGNGIMADSSGVYLTGYVGTTFSQPGAGGYDVLVRKYDAEGAVLWTRQFGSSGNDYGNGIGRSRNTIFVTGSTTGALPGQTAAGGTDGFLAELDDSTGSVTHSTQFGTGGDDCGNAVAANGSELYLAGYTYGALPGQFMAWGKDAFLRKYDVSAAPLELWTRAFPGQLTAISDEFVRAAACQDGSLYVVGATRGALPGRANAGGMDVFVRKYDSGGAELWSRQFGTSGDDAGYGVAADASGIYVTGSIIGSISGQTYVGAGDIFVRKYGFDGTELWTRLVGSTATDVGYAIATDGTDVYVTGYASGALPGQAALGGTDAFVCRYGADGGLAWISQFGTSTAEFGYGISVDAAGVCLTGGTSGALPGQNNAGVEDAFVRKLAPDGTMLWTRQFGTWSYDRGTGIWTNAGDVFVAGYAGAALAGQSSAGGRDAFLRKYDAAGSELWTRLFGTAVNDYGQGVAGDSSGVYLTGYTYGGLPGYASAGDADAMVLKYDHSGDLQWAYQFGGPATDFAYAIGLDTTGIYSAGQTSGAMPGLVSAGALDAFVARLWKADAVPPTVVGIVPPLDGGRLPAGTQALEVVFREPVIWGSSNFELRNAGLDGQFGTADDTTLSLTVSSSESTASLRFSALPVGSFRLTIRDTITDSDGNRLDGDSDGTAGGDWTCDFSTSVQPPTLTTVDTLLGASADSAFVITHAALLSAADETGPSGATISFRVEAVASGSLTKAGLPVVPGVTLLSPDESLVWLPAGGANGLQYAFTVRAWDGQQLSAAAVPVPVTVAGVAGRYLFYNNSAEDGYTLGPSPADDAAIAADTQVLLPGQPSGVSNYAAYGPGLNGIMVDFRGLPGTPGPADFEFRYGSGGDPAVWPLAPTPSIAAPRPVGDRQRVTLIWPDFNLSNPDDPSAARHDCWVEVTIRATANTGLSQAEVFYFGNVIEQAAVLPAFTPPAAEAIPTFECVSLYWSPPGGSSSAAAHVRYRVSGSSDWNEALDLWYDGRALDNRPAEYRGSIVNLRPGTAYEAELALDGTTTREVVRFTTWDDDFPIAQTIELPAFSSVPLEISGQHGSPQGYILYTGPGGDPATIDVANSYDYCIRVQDSSYVIIRGLTLTGARSDGILLGPYRATNSSDLHDLVIERNDISNWGTWDSTGQFGVNQNSGILSHSSATRRIVIQRNVIHDPRTDSNNWHEWNAALQTYHTAGPHAISLGSEMGQNVVRYNEIRGNPTHHFADAVSGWDNYSYGGFPNCDSDVYGNYVAYAWDDGIECEGANMNVRLWGNYITETFHPIALKVASLGPIYIFRNVSWIVRTAADAAYGQSFLKTGSGFFEDVFWGDGRVYVLHNTVLDPGDDGPGARGAIMDNGPIRNFVSRNNILFTEDPSSQYSILDHDRSPTNDWDYDLYNGRITAVAGAETHGVFGEPVYVTGWGMEPTSKRGLFQLADNSPGYDAGLVVPNFSLGYTGLAPDMGAHEAGTGPMEFGPDAYRMEPSLDVDGNGTADALSDGILILRYLFNPSGFWNYADAVGSGSIRTTRSAIKTYLDAGRATLLDVDGNGTPDALSDGILILRYLFTPSGQWSYLDALGADATRTTREAIKAYLDGFTPSAFQAGASGASDAESLKAAIAQVEPAQVAADTVNHAPAGTDATRSMDEDATYTFVASDFGFSDPLDTPADALQAVKITALPEAGTLTASGVAVTAGQYVSAAEIESGALAFAPAADASGAGYANFTFQVQDDGGTASLGPFSIVVLPDTQAHVAEPGWFDMQVQWICDNLTSQNVAMVTHEGDLTNTNSAAEWATAAGAMHRLDGKVPWGAIPGNRDGNQGFLDNFGPQHFAGQSWYGGSYSTSSYLYFEAGARTYLSLGIAYDAPADVITWAQDVLNANPGIPTIVTTHDFLTASGSRTTYGSTLWNSLIKTNSQIFMVLCGHLVNQGNLAHNTAYNDFNQPVFQIIANYQDMSPHDGLWLRIMQFDEANGAIHVNTYSPLYQTDWQGVFGDQYLANNRFDLTLNFADRLGPAGPQTGVDLDPTPRTMTLDVTPVNDAPRGTSATVATLVDHSYTFAVTDFGFSDPLDAPANEFSAVKVTTLPTVGSLYRSGTPVTTGQVVSVADVVSGQLTFVPPTGAEGVASTTFTFQVQDDGGTGNGGANLDPSPDTMTINVTGCDLDADGNGRADALTDGILILRYLFAPSGAWNYSDAVGVGATRNRRDEIKSFLDGGITTALDVDGNGTPDALTDGILILRYLFAPTGSWTYSDAVGVGATRTSRDQLRAFLDQFNPSMAASATLRSVLSEGSAAQEESASIALVEPSNSPILPSDTLLQPSVEPPPAAALVFEVPPQIRITLPAAQADASFTPAEASPTGQSDQHQAAQQLAIDPRTRSLVLAHWCRSKYESEVTDRDMFDKPGTTDGEADTVDSLFSEIRLNWVPTEPL